MPSSQSFSMIHRRISDSPEPAAPRGSSWRADLVVGLALLAATLAVHHRLVLHPTDLLVGTQHQGRNDLTSAFLTFQSFPRTLSERTGEWPWWNPSTLGGTPFFGNPQPALLYPPNWLTLCGVRPICPITGMPLVTIR